MKHLYLLLLFLALTFTLQAQDGEEEYGGYYFGIKGGLTIGQQQWNAYERDPLLAYHGIAFIESLPESGRFSLLAQAGYHVKGSSLRARNFFSGVSGNFLRAPAETFEFYNLSLTLGAKQVFSFTPRGGGLYYLIGLRGDYTLDTNLDRYDELGDPSVNRLRLFYPLESYEFINRFNYGLTAGGGLQLLLSEFVGVNLEFTVNPDFSVQYRQPAITNVTNPYNGQPMTLQEREIRNLTFELTLGFRFLRKIIYVE